MTAKTNLYTATLRLRREIGGTRGLLELDGAPGNTHFHVTLLVHKKLPLGHDLVGHQTRQYTFKRHDRTCWKNPASWPSEIYVIDPATQMALGIPVKDGDVLVLLVYDEQYHLMGSALYTVSIPFADVLPALDQRHADNVSLQEDVDILSWPDATQNVRPVFPPLEA
jgi:hypothetical protein